MKVKPILFLSFIFMMLSQHALCQSVVFEYNASGQRISRKIIRISTNAASFQSENDSAAYEESVSDTLFSCTLTASPNPTRGFITVSIDGGSEQAEGILVLYDSYGLVVESCKIRGNGQVDFDLSPYRSGFYYLNFVQGVNKSYYKIIKAEN